MPYPRAIARLLPALALLLAVAGCAERTPTVWSPGGTCRVERVAALRLLVAPVRRFLVTAEIDGQPVRLQVDTGAQRTVLSRDAAQRLGLRPDPEHVSVVRGQGGVVAQHDALYHSLTLGPVREAAWNRTGAHRLIVVPEPLPPAAGLPVDGLLGADLLSAFDVEIDAGRGAMNLYRVSGCAGAFIPWQGEYATLKVTRTPHDFLLLDAKVDGTEMPALIDTGSNVTEITAAAAQEVGVEGGSLAELPGERRPGVDRTPMRIYGGRFPTLTVGPVTFHDVALIVGAFGLDEAKLALGADWFLIGRVWLSYATSQVFTQRVGGGRAPAFLPRR